MLKLPKLLPNIGNNFVAQNIISVKYNNYYYGMAKVYSKFPHSILHLAVIIEWHITASCLDLTTSL